ncbi:MAG: GNAT family N-acetyltransferase [Bacteroidales bacterium]|nr:GNAT family N-acetyltransferase [Bacteroidales bacterium]
MLIAANTGIILRKLEFADKKRLAQLANNKKIWDNVRDYFPYPYTKKDATEFIESCRKEDPEITFAVVFNNELVGVAGLVLQTDIYKNTAEIGYWIGEEYWNKGIATQAVRLLVSYGFENLKLHRIFTGVFEYNKASQKVLEKCGFVHEGTSKKSITKNNAIIDEYRYGIVIE